MDDAEAKGQITGPVGRVYEGSTPAKSTNAIS
jgi:hypothetical protein